MTRSATPWIAAFAAAVMVSSILEPSARAQNPDSAAVAMRLEVQNGTYTDSTYFVYQEPDRIDLILELYNRSNAPVWVEDRVVRRIGIQVSWIDGATGAASDVPVHVDWLGIIEQHLEAPIVAKIPVPTMPEQQSLLDDQRFVTWIVSVRRADGGPFVSGRYRFEVTMPDIRSGLRTSDGEVWRGEVPSGQSIELVAKAPSTADEWARHYQQEGWVAERRHQWNEALAYYLRMLEIDPSGPLSGVALNRVGGMYMRLGRYAEAITVLRRLPPDNYNSLLLAGAYLRAGDEAGALDALRRAGLSEDLVQEQLEMARQALRRSSGR